VNVWYCIPVHSGAAALECLCAWRGLGYNVAVVGESSDLDVLGKVADPILRCEKYVGYGEAVNRLWKEVGARADIFVTGGYDVWPDSRFYAEEASRLYLEHFPSLEGVMQPTGDRLSEFATSAPSPWLGYKFSLSVYSGAGPFWPGYFHWGVDWELLDVASAMGVYVREPRLAQYHAHWTRIPGSSRPSHLLKAVSKQQADRMLYQTRKADGFPGACGNELCKDRMEDTL
jgi:hypothetical protein